MNSGYLFIGRALAEVLFQFGLLGLEVGGDFGISTCTALIFFIFIQFSAVCVCIQNC